MLHHGLSSAPPRSSVTVRSLQDTHRQTDGHAMAAGTLTTSAPFPRSQCATAFNKSFCFLGGSETNVPLILSGPLGFQCPAYPLVCFMLDDSSLKDLSPSLRLLCHQLPRQPVEHQKKHSLLFLYTCGECLTETKHFLRLLATPDLSQPWGLDASSQALYKVLEKQ